MVAASQRYEPGDDADMPAAKSSKGVASLTVSIPGMSAAAGEERKDGEGKSTMDDLLSGFEDELGIENAGEDFGEDSAAAISQEVNLLKQASSVQLELAMKKEQSLSTGDAIDQYMPTENVLAAMQKIDDEKKREISLISKNDPQYKEKVKAIEQRAKQTKYKTMKNLNTANEKVPEKVKANMKRRGSI